MHSGFGSLELRGLSTSGCAGSALTAVAGQHLVLQDVVLQKHNRKWLADMGGGLYVQDVQQVRVRTQQLLAMPAGSCCKLHRIAFAACCCCCCRCS